MKQKILALATTLALCIALVGCSLSTPESVGTVGGVEISSGLYLLAQYNAYQSAASYADSDQDTGKPSKFLKQTINVGDEENADNQTVSDYVSAKTLETLRNYAAVEVMFDEMGGELTDAEIAAADSYAQQLMDNYGDTYSANGIGLSTLQSYERNLYKTNALLELLYGQNGSDAVSDAELTAYMNSNLINATYVTIPLYNISTFVFADSDQTTQMVALAKEAAAACNALDGDVEENFDEVLHEYMPQIYAVMDMDYSEDDLHSDLQSALFTQSDLSTYFNDEAQTVLGSLAFDQVAAVQYSDYSIIILLRTDPIAEYSLDSVRSTALSDMKSDDLNDAIAARGAELDVALDSSATSKLPAKKISIS
jgi:hypothetical protein